MLPELPVKKIVRTETLKLSILTSLIIIGGIILASFIPSTEALNWIDFTFYASIGSLVIVYQSFSFYIKTRKIKRALNINFNEVLDEDIPVTKTDVIGKQENNVDTKRGIIDFLESNREMFNILSNKPLFQTDYHELDGDHTWGFWQKNLPDALSYFINIWK